MMAQDRDALLCDLAETYGIFDLQALPATTLAALAVGLRDDSRIKMKLCGDKIPRQELLLAAMVDRLSLLVWMRSEDGRNGVNQPASLVKRFTADAEPEAQTVGFVSPVEFEAEWARITGVSHG